MGLRKIFETKGDVAKKDLGKLASEGLMIFFVTYYDLSSSYNVVKVTKLRKLKSEASIWSKSHISIGLL
jgi:hypothetical protein